MNKLHRILAVAALTSLVATSAMAETASDTVDAKAGLQPSLELSCSDVSFGVWRVPLRTSGGTTTITLDRSTDAVAASGNTARVAQSLSDVSWTHSRGECTLSGSTAADGAEATISISDNTNMPFVPAAAASTGYVGLDQATQGASLTCTLDAPATVAIASGSATFYVGGTLTIPQNIIADNYGGYKTSTPATIAAEDNE